MHKYFFPAFILFSFILFTGEGFSQESDFNVVHIQTWKLKAMLVGDEADAFNEMLKRQSDVVNKDARVMRSYVLRHYWGADSRDLVIVTEFDAAGDMFAFFDQFGAMMEGAFSEEQLKKDTDLWNKYVGQHADEVYQVTEGTRK